MKELTKAEFDLLIAKNQQFAVARAGLDEFVLFLQKQHDCDGWQLSQDGKGFMEPPKPEKPVEKK